MTFENKSDLQTARLPALKGPDSRCTVGLYFGRPFGSNVNLTPMLMDQNKENHSFDRLFDYNLQL